MKRFLCALFAALLLIPAAFAEDLDLSGMTVDELKALRDRIDAELIARESVVEVKTVIETEKLKLVVTSFESTVSPYTDNTIFTVYMDWTNKTSAPERLSRFLNTAAYADGIEITCDRDEFSTKIRPGITLTVSVYCFAPPETKTIDIDITDPYRSKIYSTLSFTVGDE